LTPGTGGGPAIADDDPGCLFVLRCCWLARWLWHVLTPVGTLRFFRAAFVSFPLGFLFLCYGELRGEMREGSTQAVELGTFFFFYFFVFCFWFFLTFFFPRQVEYSVE
jgi:hypothetical protein